MAGTTSLRRPAAPPTHSLPCLSSARWPTRTRFARARVRLTVGLKDTENLVAGDRLDLGDAVRVTEDNADLRGRETATGELEDLVLDLLGGGLRPRRLRAAVGERRGGDTLALHVRTVLPAVQCRMTDLRVHSVTVSVALVILRPCADIPLPRPVVPPPREMRACSPKVCHAKMEIDSTHVFHIPSLATSSLLSALTGP